VIGRERRFHDVLLAGGYPDRLLQDVVIVGHPYPETLDVLTDALPRLREQGMRLVKLSEIMPRTLVD